MKAFLKTLTLQTVLLLLSTSVWSSPKAGFYLPDSVQSVTLKYKVINNLIILPVTINDSIQLNLILDTGCRNLVLFGKRYQKLFTLQPTSRVQFSGLGSGDPVYGRLSLNNTVSIGEAIGNNIPVVVVSDKNLFSSYVHVHGVIGYDIFTKFEVELNPVLKEITLRPAGNAELSSLYTRVPIRVVDSRPIIDCQVVFTKDKKHLCDLMIDTGSSLGLLLKTTMIENFKSEGSAEVLGRGFNGIIEGIRTVTKKLVLQEMEIASLSTGIIQSPWHNYASIGMDVLKEYTLVLNYCKGYAGFRKT
jgi:hypothetical protein